MHVVRYKIRALLLPTRSAAQHRAMLSILLLPHIIIKRHNFVRWIRWIRLRKSSFRSYDYTKVVEHDKRACDLISGVILKTKTTTKNRYAVRTCCMPSETSLCACLKMLIMMHIKSIIVRITGTHARCWSGAMCRAKISKLYLHCTSFSIITSSNIEISEYIGPHTLYCSVCTY